MKKQLIDKIIDVEGGYVNDPNDSGGETNYGITEAVARAAGYAGAMIDLPRTLAYNIYADRYWNGINADKMPPGLAHEVVDTAINMGVNRAGTFLQRSLNVLNRATGLYADLVVDGDVGPTTIRTLNAYLVARDEHTLVKALNCLQGAFYIELAERREKDEAFVYGWLKNRVTL